MCHSLDTSLSDAAVMRTRPSRMLAEAPRPIRTSRGGTGRPRVAEDRPMHTVTADIGVVVRRAIAMMGIAVPSCD